MRCAFCDAEFTPKRSTGKYCSTRCRCAAWQRKRGDELAIVDEQLTRALTRVQALRGMPAKG